ncbi:hypothetical protein NQ314_001054 [Rhamnusium bicolor]|uniref:Uncharacterized protein n=1 Tax=Rhamnusium bicolor TaxID=1586634 RepID=A0AAV8ZUZ9_9CUCU|nr:hypothetical protein NQ314_001054 [Rhamnusium bicolor]
MLRSKKQKFAALLVILLLQEPVVKARKRFWVKNWLLERDTLSHMTLVRKLRESAKDDLKNYLRMDDMCFYKLLDLVKPYISKKNTVMRKAISPEERLVVTLRYLATGRGLEDLKFSAVISPQAQKLANTFIKRPIYLRISKRQLSDASWPVLKNHHSHKMFKEATTRTDR